MALLKELSKCKLDLVESAGGPMGGAVAQNLRESRQFCTERGIRCRFL
jgi:hypothetical protein